MATTDNAADVKKICSSTVNLIDDNPWESILRYFCRRKRDLMPMAR
jgi:hypothetical protein